MTAIIGLPEKPCPECEGTVSEDEVVEANGVWMLKNEWRPVHQFDRDSGDWYACSTDDCVVTYYNPETGGVEREDIGNPPSLQDREPEGEYRP